MYGVSTHGKITLDSECMYYQHLERQHYTRMRGVSTHGKITLDTEYTEYQHMARQH